jgi:hypothetical protein
MASGTTPFVPRCFETSLPAGFDWQPIAVEQHLEAAIDPYPTNGCSAKIRAIRTEPLGIEPSL